MNVIIQKQRLIRKVVASEEMKEILEHLQETFEKLEKKLNLIHQTSRDIFESFTATLREMMSGSCPDPVRTDLSADIRG